MNKPEYYISKVTAKKYPYEEYVNHGRGGVYKGYMDLPTDEYPYSVIYVNKFVDNFPHVYSA